MHGCPFIFPGSTVMRSNVATRQSLAYIAADVSSPDISILLADERSRLSMEWSCRERLLLACDVGSNEPSKPSLLLIAELGKPVLNEHHLSLVGRKILDGDERTVGQKLEGSIQGDVDGSS